MPEAATTDQPQAEFEDDLSAGRAPEPDIEIAPAPPFAMSAELANALTVRAPLTEPQLLGMIRQDAQHLHGPARGGAAGSGA